MSAFNASATVGSFVTLRTWTQERGEVPSFPSCTYRFFCERRKVSTYTEGEHKRYIRLHCIETLQLFESIFPLIDSANTMASGLKMRESHVFIHSEPRKYFSFVSLLPSY